MIKLLIRNRHLFTLKSESNTPSIGLLYMWRQGEVNEKLRLKINKNGIYVLKHVHSKIDTDNYKEIYI